MWIEEVDVRREPGTSVMAKLRRAFDDDLRERYPESGVSYGPETLPDGMFRPTGGFFVLFDNEDPVGCVGLRKLPDQFAKNMGLDSYEAAASCEGKSLYMHPRVRGTFGAAILMRALVESAIGLGYDFMYGNTGYNQPESQRVLLSFGKLRGFNDIQTTEIPLYDPSNKLAAYAVKLDLRKLVLA